MKKLIVIITVLWGGLLGAQQTPAPAQKTPITISGATAHLGNGKIITNALITFADGKITFVGKADQGTPVAGEVIDAQGKHLYPGFIAPAKSLGLIEINAVRASNDEDDIGEFIPHVRSLIAYNAESQVVESMRPNGILIGQTTPQGGTISGTSSIVQFDAWNWEDAAIKVDDGIHMHWPSSFRQGRWWLGEPRGFQPNKEYTKATSKITNYLANAKAYGNGDGQALNQGFAAMQGLFKGTQTLYVYAHAERDITDAITFTKAAGVKKVVLIGGYQADKVTALLKKHQVAVFVRQTHTLPFMEDHAYDLPYKLPKLLTDAGVLVGLQNAEASNFQTRNLPFYAGQLVGQGMDKEQALQLITGNTAKILGIDDAYGTLEVGKSATLFLSEGDALDMAGNQLIQAYIDGRKISLETHQTKLWKRYQNKFDGK